MDNERAWAPGLPHMPARELICDLHDGLIGPAADARVCTLLGRQAVRPVTTNLDAALDLIPEGWWWHLSHLEACVTPTVDLPDVPISNANAYNEFGESVKYSGTCWEKSKLPVAVCEAMLKATYDLPAALYVRKSGKEESSEHARIWRRRRSRRIPKDT